MAVVWLFFLLFPLQATIVSDADRGVKVLTVAAILGFMIAYTCFFSRVSGWEQLPARKAMARALENLGMPLAVMLLLVLLALPGLGRWAVYFLPFFSAVVLFMCPLRMGLSIVAFLSVAAILVVALLDADLPTRWTVIGCTMSSLFICIARIMAEVQHRQIIQDRELAATAEREEMGRQVHDVLGHSLTVLTLRAEVAQHLVRSDPEAAERELTQIIGLSRSALADVRATARRFRVPDLAGQLEASRLALDAAGVTTEFAGLASEIPGSQHELFAWVLREATTNVLRHAGARHTRVELAPGLLRVIDDGSGIGGSVPGNGLRGMRERVEAAGGTIRLVSPTGRAQGGRAGTMLEVLL